MTARRVFFAWTPALLYMAAIWCLSAIGSPGKVVFSYQDKVIHAAEFAGLVFAFGYATRRTWAHLSRWRELVLLILYAGTWGLLDELHQAFVPGRSADLSDLVADIAGASAAAVLRAFWPRGKRAPT